MRCLYILLFLFLSPILHAAKITGSFAPSDTITILTLISMDYDTRNDSVIQKIRVGADKKFQLDIALKEPTLFGLGNAGGAALVMLVVKPEDVIALKFNGQEITVTGSIETQYMIDYENYRRKMFYKWLRPAYDSSAAAKKSGNKEKMEYWNDHQTYAMAQYKAELSNWARQSFFIGSLASIHHSLRWNPDADSSLIDTLLAAYQKNYKGYALTRQFEKKVEGIKKIALGVVPPSFHCFTEEGFPFDFKKIPGKYVLLDFWASWCPPCREESPTLVRLYNEYKDKGFTIISISLDDDQKKWIKAIKKDQYTWTNVSELKGWKSPTAAQYSVSSIPASFLLDPEGRIIAKNLRGKALEKKLSELMLK